LMVELPARREEVALEEEDGEVNGSEEGIDWNAEVQAERETEEER
jgi:hypothetical protein